MNKNKWSWWMFSLWGYTLLLIGFVVASNIFFPRLFNSEVATELDSLLGGILFLPALILVILVGKDHLGNR